MAVEDWLTLRESFYNVVWDQFLHHFAYSEDGGAKFRPENEAYSMG